MPLLVLLNNFLHDFSAAGWIFSGLALNVLTRYCGIDVDSRRGVVPAARMLRRLMRLSLAGIVVFGVVRALTYKTYEWMDAAGPGQVWLLALKHVILIAIFLVGLRAYIKAGRYMGEVESEQQQ